MCVEKCGPGKWILRGMFEKTSLRSCSGRKDLKAKERSSHTQSWVNVPGGRIFQKDIQVMLCPVANN